MGVGSSYSGSFGKLSGEIPGVKDTPGSTIKIEFGLSEFHEIQSYSLLVHFLAHFISFYGSISSLRVRHRSY